MAQTRDDQHKATHQPAPSTGLKEHCVAYCECCRQQIAQGHGFTVVDGRIPLPDLRIEYETAERDQTKVDPKIVTSNYHRDSLAAKTAAGSSIYALHEDVGPLREAIDDPELTKDILSL